MARYSTLFLLFLAASWQTAGAQDKGFGLGVVFGEPSGLSGKSWLGKKTALAGAVAWSFERKSALHIHVDHLFHDFESVEVEQGRLALYYGIGGKIRFADESTLGVRIPIGVNYLFPRAPVDIFLEIVPILDLVPSTELSLNAGIGVRYFFPPGK